MNSNTQSQSYYTHGYDAELSKSHKWRTVENSCKHFKNLIKPTDVVLDVGCGPGSITLDLANYVPNGKVVGIEPTRELIDECVRNTNKQTNVEFKLASGYNIPFSDNTFDIVHCHQVLIHLEDPILVLKEMRRVCKPNGIVCCKECDPSMSAVYPEKHIPALSSYFTKMKEANGRLTDQNMGRKLKTLALRSGFHEQDITFSVDHWCYSTAKDRQLVGERYIERITYSKEQFDKFDPIADEQLRNSFVDGWKKWIMDDEALLVFNHGEVVCLKRT
ncbi:hypothetical protein ZYGM_000569 [Zygosaccharomyces mellis]|uniref:Methyltransferase domain-containing protein n=1 Tax=Zygosaccharomyces mellis TaxID=42258 RepID=A0A4C2EE64_9SACH|nr:hypothetical protein ZYGM_000569 [Zygosaccharomyces mellis]